jgi:hypothetical protein
MLPECCVLLGKTKHLPAIHVLAKSLEFVGLCDVERQYFAQHNRATLIEFFV